MKIYSPTSLQYDHLHMHSSSDLSKVTNPSVFFKSHLQAQKFSCCFGGIGRKICSVLVCVKEKIFAFFSRIFSVCSSKTVSKQVKSSSLPKEKEKQINNPKILNASKTSKTSEIKLIYEKKGKNIFIKEIEVTEENKDALPQRLEKILQEEVAGSFILENLAYGVIFKEAGYDTNSKVYYDPEQEKKGLFEQLIQKLLAKKEESYSTEKQKAAFRQIQQKTAKDLSSSSLFGSFFKISHAILLDLSDVLELVKEESFEEIRKIPLSGRDVQRGGIFYFPRMRDDT